MIFFKSLMTRGEWATIALALASICAMGALGKEIGQVPVVHGSYIVEFVGGSGADAPAFYNNLTSNKIDAIPRMTLAHKLFNGVSFKLEGSHDNETTIQTIHSMAMVNKIWPVRLHRNPATGISAIDGIKTESTLLRKRAVVDAYPPHVMGGVDKLHAGGFTGEGLFIGVIDTGVDYKHRALGGGFGPGHKVVAGYDLVGDAYDGTNTPIPDHDPMDCNGHGTHVSGIIGADPNPFNFTGVAPNATLGMWRVFGCYGSSGSDVMIAAFNMAYEAGVDLISASVGGPRGWTEDPWNVAVQRITEKGVPCILAAGNDGRRGLFSTSTPSESIGATSVGSVDSISQPVLKRVAKYLLNGGNATKFEYDNDFGDFGTITVPVYALTLSNTVAADACSPLPASTPDLSPYIVLIRLGTCSSYTKIANAMAYRAKRVLLYSAIPVVSIYSGDTPISLGNTSLGIAIGKVSNIQGAEWISELKAGISITVEFLAEKDAELEFTSQPNIHTGGYMSHFSSWGPSYEAWIKPEVSAPGGTILSTIPLAQGGYGVLSGTSMATPYISGVVALIKQIRGRSLSPDSLNSLLASTAEPIYFNDGATTYDYLAPVVQQGGGLVDAYNAAYTTTLLDLDNIALNDTSHFKAAHSITISNTGNVPQIYTFANVEAATAYTLSGAISPTSFPPSLSANASSGAAIRFEPPSLAVGPKSSAVVTLHFTRPAGLDEVRIPVYSGFVIINGSCGDALSLPYAGIASRLKDATVVNYADRYPYLAKSSSINTSISANGTVFTLPGNSTSNSTAGFPTIVYALAMGSRIVRVDVVPEDPRGLPRIIGQQVLGSIPGYPVENCARLGMVPATWDGRLASGRWAPEGNYSLMLRALRILGDVTNDHDYERYESVRFEIKYTK